MSVGSFSIGLRFYYWKEYKELEEMPPDEQENGMIRNHSGFKIRELWIDQKYGSFGEEIMNYNHIDIDIKQFKDLIMTKAELYINTKRGRAAKANTCSGPRHYEIKHGAPITINHLLSLMLYTDTTTLSSNFSASFRKLHAYDTLSQIKKRNSRYFHWSKRLREAVELFGDYNYNIDPPFYTGISCVMEMQSLSIRLCAPTSTSVQMEVAVKFSGSNGIIIQLTTKGIMTGNAAKVRGFDVSWLSQFKEEDERYQYLLSSFYLYTFLLLFIQTVLWRFTMFGNRINQINE